MQRGLFPRSGPRTHASRAEIKLYQALERYLPAEWTAWHSMKVRVPLGPEGEGDFVVAIPGRGALVIEVKGGRIELVDGRFMQNGRELEKPPREQAHEFKRKLLGQLEDRHPDSEPPFVAIVTAFPDTYWDDPPSNGDIEGALLGAQDLPYLSEALHAISERLLKPDRAPDWPWIEALHEIWGESWLPAISLGTKTRLAEAKLIELDSSQRDVLAAVTDNPALYCEGPPGTGKSLLAMEIARRWSEKGRNPVLLCFTRALAMDLRAQGHDAWTVRELAAEILQRANVLIENGAAQADWPSETWSKLPLLAIDVLKREPLHYDAVVIDEAQDLSANDWELVRAIAKDGPLWAFGDEGQGFWPERREVPPDVRPFVFRLSERYRCPPALTAFADLYRHNAPDPPNLPSRIDELSVLPVPRDSVELGCAVTIENLVAQGVRLDQIAILSLAGQSRTTLAKADKIGSFEVVRADDPQAGEKLVAETFLRFKGLERPWIVVTELGLAETNYDIRMHIALTRATVGCIVVATEAEIASDPRLVAV